MKAFALGVTNIADGINNVSWNSPSGTYIVKVPGASQLLVHFNAGTGSAPALQLRADYANRGLWYRSARDDKGFEKGWTKLATQEDVSQGNNIPVGSPVPWLQATPPAGYLACSGQTFNKSTYPKLAIAYPSGKLPDLRGEFIRGLDSGRGIDTGRTVLSAQKGNSLLSSNIFGGLSSLESNKWHKAINYIGISGTDNDGGYGVYQQIEGVNGNETRPRNIAFLYIVRTA